LKKVDAFSAESEMLSALKTLIFLAFLSALKVKCFQPNFVIFFTLFSSTVKTLQNPYLGSKH
jgi:hypothetical protein